MLVSRSASAPHTGQETALPGFVAVQRVPRLTEVGVVGQFDGQLVFRNRHRAALGTVDDGDRAAPVALARYPPIPQPVLDHAVAGFQFLQLVDGCPLGAVHVEAVEELGN